MASQQPAQGVLRLITPKPGCFLVLLKSHLKEEKMKANVNENLFTQHKHWQCNYNEFRDRTQKKTLLLSTHTLMNLTRKFSVQGKNYLTKFVFWDSFWI